MPRDTGFPAADAQSDFLRARRANVLSRLAQRLRREPDDVNLILPFEEVVEALGRAGERRLGLKSIPLDSILGSVDRTKEFDRRFRPTSSRLRPRWERIAVAQRRGQSMPPISVYRIGSLHFVQDGHHRVSVARALGLTHIDAYVTEVLTKIGAGAEVSRGDLPLKSHERLFFERVPLPADVRGRIRPSDPWDYGPLAEGVEAWGFRCMQEGGELLDRAAVAASWFEDEYTPVVEMLREDGLLERGTETDAYMRVSAARYRLLRTHEWSEDIVRLVHDELGGRGASRGRRSPPAA